MTMTELLLIFIASTEIIRFYCEARARFHHEMFIKKMIADRHITELLLGTSDALTKLEKDLKEIAEEQARRKENVLPS